MAEAPAPNSVDHLVADMQALQVDINPHPVFELFDVVNLRNAFPGIPEGIVHFKCKICDQGERKLYLYFTSFFIINCLILDPFNVIQ